VRSGLRRHRSVKLSYHSPFVSTLEGIISRGDERVGELLLQAYRRGARLDAWEERFDRELWRSILGAASWNPVGALLEERDPQVPLPWDDISIRVSKAALRVEYERASRAEITDACMSPCTHPCGACTGDGVDESNRAQSEAAQISTSKGRAPVSRIVGRLVFRISKIGKASYLQLTYIDSLSRAFLMSDLPLAYSEGFNPLPRLESGQPLPIAFESQCEIATLLLVSEADPDSVREALMGKLPDGLRVEECAYYPVREGIKQRSIGSLAWGSRFRISQVLPLEAPNFHAVLRAKTNLLSVESAELFEDTDGSCVVLLPEPSSKEMGLVKILERCVPQRPIQAVLRIQREFFFADIGNGPISFFDAYAAIS
jgi:radical SAM-linked protein